MIKPAPATHRLVTACACLVGTALAITGCKSNSTATGSDTGATTTASTSAASTSTVAAPPAASASGSAASPGAGSAAAPSTGSAGGPASGKLDGVPKSCPPADKVMSTLHLSSLVVGAGDPSICQYLYRGDKASPYVVITFNAAPGYTKDMLKSGLTAEQKDVAPVAGLGEAAFSFTTDPGRGLTFFSGGTICSIDTTVPTTTDDEIALAKSLLAG